MVKNNIDIDEEKLPAENVQTAEKTFTQKEVDEIVKARLERAKKDVPTKEELDEFRSWKEDRMTFERKAFDEIAAANSAREAAENDKHIMELMITCLTKGVLPEYADDVITLAKKLTNENTSIESAVSAVVEKYPMFCGKDRLRTLYGMTTGARTQTVPTAANTGRSSFIDVIKQNQAKRK